jgi:hypothetical protein
MRFGQPLRYYWPEALLFLAVALPWLSLFVLGLVWLWQGGHVWVWAIGAATLGLLAVRFADRDHINQYISKCTFLTQGSEYDSRES